MTDPAHEEMPVRDERVPDEQYDAFLDRMPQVCVELVLEDDGVLLVERTIEPEVWFWPGSRLYKGEDLETAARRVAREELGIAVRLLEQLGVQEHRWRGSGESPSRHTVNVVYHAVPAEAGYEIALDDDHAAYRFVSEPTPELHEYVRRYLRRYDLS